MIIDDQWFNEWVRPTFSNALEKAHYGNHSIFLILADCLQHGFNEWAAGLLNSFVIIRSKVMIFLILNDCFNKLYIDFQLISDKVKHYDKIALKIFKQRILSLMVFWLKVCFT